MGACAGHAGCRAGCAGTPGLGVGPIAALAVGEAPCLRENAVEALLLYPQGGAYFGTVREDLPHGFGVEMAVDGTMYEGEFKEGVRHGPGRETNALGAVFSGTFVEGFRHGEGLSGLRPQGLPVHREVWEAGCLSHRQVAIPVPKQQCPVPATVASEADGGRGGCSAPLSPWYRRSPGCRGELKPVGSWSEEEVQWWLRANGLGRFAPAFREAKVTGEQLLTLDHRELETRLHVLRYGHRCRLLGMVRQAALPRSQAPERAGSGGDGGSPQQLAPVPEMESRAVALLAIPPEQLQPEERPGTSHAQVLFPSASSQGGAASGGRAGSCAWRDDCPVHSTFRGYYLGKDVAVRALRGRLRQVEAARWRKTVLELAALRHPGLALFLGVAARGPPGSPPPPWAPRAGSCAVVAECAAGTSLRAWLERPTADARVGAAPPPSMQALLRVARGIAVALAYLHSRAVWHLRLRPASILLDNDTLTVKVTDYAVSALESRLEAPRPHRLRGCCPWTPPEALRASDHPPTGADDVHAFGVILWELLARRPPFEGLTAAQLVLAVGFARRRLPRLRAPPPALWALTRACLRFDPARRPSFKDTVMLLERLEAGGSAKEDALSAFFCMQ